MVNDGIHVTIYSSTMDPMGNTYIIHDDGGPIHYDMSVQQTCRYMFILVYIGVCSGCSDVS